MKNKAETERFQFGVSQNSLNTLPNQIIVFFFLDNNQIIVFFLFLKANF
jgi:hypothetical protein